MCGQHGKGTLVFGFKWYLRRKRKEDGKVLVGKEGGKLLVSYGHLQIPRKKDMS